MTDTTHYRLAQSKDAACIQQLLSDLALSLGEEDLYQGSEASLLQFGFQKNPFFRAFLAWQNQDAVGLCLFFPEFSTWRGQPGVYIQDLYIKEHARGQGIGKDLLSKASDFSATEWQCSYLRLSVNLSNQAAQTFYQTLGLTPDNESSIFKIGGPAFQSLANSAE